MHGSEHASDLGYGLAAFYLLCFLLNVGIAAFYQSAKNKAQALLWGVVAILFLALGITYLVAGFNGSGGPALPQSFRDAIDWAMGPIIYTALSVIGFIVVLYWRRFFTQPVVGLLALNLSFLAAGWAMTEPNFRSIMTKPDNVPIPLLIYSVGFTTWIALRRAVINDDRMAKGEPPVEKLEDEKVLVWPDLVYTELIAMIICTVILIVWAIVLKAPLEAPATAAKAPNPSKAPWYFLGLQEMLVYYDPWMAGVVLPTMILVGLIAIPYIDFNPKGSGYYTFNQRKFAVVMFLFGFVVLWVTLIVLGTILRGPNWNFFGPFEYWDTHKVLPLNNVNLSQIFWQKMLGIKVEGMPWYKRELPGIILVVLYMFGLPPLMARLMRGFFVRMGFLRFFMLVTLIQFMAALPIKMILRWTINLKYIVFIPEYFFNI
jgi:Cytochrome b(C-terminal)/b6/petD